MSLLLFIEGKGVNETLTAKKGEGVSGEGGGALKTANYTCNISMSSSGKKFHRIHQNIFNFAHSH